MSDQLYGVDLTKEAVTPSEALGAVVKCFQDAHKEVLSEMKEYGENISKEEMSKMESIAVEALIRNFFKETGGDFEHPTKEQIKNVLVKLADFAKNFRNPDLVQKHYEEITRIMEKVS